MSLKEVWSDIYNNSITPALTEALYANWLARLDLARECQPLTSQHVHRTTVPGFHMDKLRGNGAYRLSKRDELSDGAGSGMTGLAVNISAHLSQMNKWTSWLGRRHSSLPKP